MELKKKSFDNDIFWKYLWRKIYNFILKKWWDWKVLSIANSLWKQPWNLYDLLNWKRTTSNTNSYKEIAIAWWMTENDFEELVKEAKRVEFEETTWEKIEKEVDFKIAFKKEYWKELTENDKAILDRIFKENWF